MSKPGSFRSTSATERTAGRYRRTGKNFPSESPRQQLRICIPLQKIPRALTRSVLRVSRISDRFADFLPERVKIGEIIFTCPAEKPLNVHRRGNKTRARSVHRESTFKTGEVGSPASRRIIDWNRFEIAATSDAEDVKHTRFYCIHKPFFICCFYR